jgi:hypothetical protein
MFVRSRCWLEVVGVSPSSRVAVAFRLAEMFRSSPRRGAVERSLGLADHVSIHTAYLADSFNHSFSSTPLVPNGLEDTAASGNEPPFSCSHAFNRGYQNAIKDLLGCLQLHSPPELEAALQPTSSSGASLGSSFAVTERTGNLPEQIHTRFDAIEDDASSQFKVRVTGEKSFVSGFTASTQRNDGKEHCVIIVGRPTADLLKQFVKQGAIVPKEVVPERKKGHREAATESASAHSRLPLLVAYTKLTLSALPSSVTATPIPTSNLLPDACHSSVRFDRHDAEILSSANANDQTVELVDGVAAMRAFRAIEDLHIALAIAGFMAKLGEGHLSHPDHRSPKIERLVAELAETVASALALPYSVRSGASHWAEHPVDAVQLMLLDLTLTRIKRICTELATVLHPRHSKGTGSSGQSAALGGPLGGAVTSKQAAPLDGGSQTASSALDVNRSPTIRFWDQVALDLRILDLAQKVRDRRFQRALDSALRS